MKQNQAQILKKFEPFLWSYDVSQMDIKKHKKRIITNVLNFGTKEATDFLFTVYGKEEIKDQVKNPLPGQWNDKSLNYWSIIFGLKPKKVKDILRHIG